ncbi:hypothetical protein Y981_09225 [Leptospirillum ferriphilum YSK]|uniref:Uncharacterized protein n=1 Tax=Leptospirillum ferriphilum YSK TaxID=1441628 RepID=A0A059XTC7_9BACT|nr:hypothetical protein Y981_09225 [Leptospirillum ferriphilum YSK]
MFFAGRRVIGSPWEEGRFRDRRGCSWTSGQTSSEVNRIRVYSKGTEAPSSIHQSKAGEPFWERGGVLKNNAVSGGEKPFRGRKINRSGGERFVLTTLGAIDSIAPFASH